MAYDSISAWTAAQSPAFSANWFFMRPRLVPQPKGVVLVIAPFNYPLFLLLVPLVRVRVGSG